MTRKYFKRDYFVGCTQSLIVDEEKYNIFRDARVKFCLLAILLAMFVLAYQRNVRLPFHTKKRPLLLALENAISISNMSNPVWLCYTCITYYTLLHIWFCYTCIIGVNATYGLRH